MSLVSRLTHCLQLYIFYKVHAFFSSNTYLFDLLLVVGVGVADLLSVDR